MEKSLLDYDQSLEELNRQKQKLEIVMKRMGEEWAESGAGVGWLNDIMDEYPSIPNSSRRNSTTRGTTTTTTTTAALMVVPSSSLTTTMKGNDNTDNKGPVNEENRDVEA
ncbi:hypothetical protein K492DRAFT_239937 [Lichtheimia hyalospora FSU 10163]|nr:hypothetical protein K492DRAFT_239937 [Lichtheimia hyalospora FSU 10163]